MSNNGSVGMAWGCTIAAAGSTLIGALFVVLVPPTHEKVPCWVIAASMAMAAGVMLYVAITEMFKKSEEAFGLAGEGEVTAKFHANLCFFGGCIFMILSSQMV